jgi:hypothetical protein
MDRRVAGLKLGVIGIRANRVYCAVKLHWLQLLCKYFDYSKSSRSLG